MKRTEKFWDRIAKNYETQISESDQTAIKTLELTKKYLHQDDLVLDYGCATGNFAFEVAELVKEIHGIDISSEMIAIATRSAEERNIEHAHFSQTAIFDERFKPGTFDVILAFNILHLLEDPQHVVGRISELLKPGGVFISATACMGKGRSFLRFILWPLSKIGAVPYLNFFRPSDVEDLISRGMFEIVETEILSPSPLSYYVAARKSAANERAPSK